MTQDGVLPPATTRIGELVLATVRDVAHEHGQAIPPLHMGLRLIDSGLDSLCLAVVVARLEDSLGVDPLATSPEAALPETVGDLVAMYESAAG